MRKMLFAPLALALAALPGSVLALEAGADMQVTIDDEDVGEWYVSTIVRDEGDQCRYNIRWSYGDEGTTLITKRCEVLEQKTARYFSCHQDNQEENFPTSIEVGDACEGFDSFGQLVNIDELTAAESTNGVSGVILVEGEDEYQGFEVG